MPATSLSYGYTIICMSSGIFDLLCHVVLSLLYSITALLPILYCSFIKFYGNEPPYLQLRFLKSFHDALVFQGEDILWQVAELDTIIHHMYTSICPSPTVQHLFTSSATQHITMYPDSMPITPTRLCRRRHSHQHSVGRPYPLPFTPARTPDEEHRNSIIEWVNNLHFKQYNKMTTNN